MRNRNKILASIHDFVAIRFRHHRVLYMVTLTIISIYLIIRLFLMPPLLSGTQFSNAYYDRNGQLMRMTLAADDKFRLYTPLNKIAKSTQIATILYEDKYFKYHIGINPISLIKSTFSYFRGAPHPAGASTITMQVARMKYAMDTRSITGKLKQIAAAIYIDTFYSKNKILEAYLNLAPYGANIEGIGAASIIYFKKPASDLTTIESITLSTIPQNPIKRSLNTDAGLAHMQKMRGDLVRRWIKSHPQDQNLTTLATMPLATYRISDLPFLAPHFIDNQVQIRNEYFHNKISDGEIRTTIDMGLQSTLEQKLKNEVKRRKNIGINNAAAIVVNYKTMETLAYIGAADYFDQSIYGQNDGVRARRSPGSTLKPLIYAAAANMGLIHGMTLLKDAKISFGVYAPENADSEFYGPVLARDALTHSRNIPAINLTRKIGARNFYKLLADCGVTGLRSPEHYGISIALGGAEVSMFELAQIYATMANLGLVQEIKTQIQTNDGPQATQVLSPEAFFLVLDMLGRQRTAQNHIPFAKHHKSNIRHYWKTGTSSSYRDAWTAGIFGDYVLIIWTGNFNGAPNNAFSGARVAAPIYFAMADTIAQYDASHGHPIQNNNFLRSDLNISQIDMCDHVGGIAGTYCPHIIKSYFIPGTSPIETTSVYRAVAIDKQTGLRACAHDTKKTYMAVYEFWDAEYLDMFRRAGIRRRTPPPFMPDCDLTDIATGHPDPIITSPADGIKLVITSDMDTEPVTFQATGTDTNAKMFWFLDDEMIGTTKSGETIRVNVSMGAHTVRVADEMGGGAIAQFTVVK